jgi:hypothetical protein
MTTTKFLALLYERKCKGFSRKHLSTIQAIMTQNHKNAFIAHVVIRSRKKTPRVSIANVPLATIRMISYGRSWRLDLVYLSPSTQDGSSANRGSTADYQLEQSRRIDGADLQFNRLLPANRQDDCRARRRLSNRKRRTH